MVRITEQYRQLMFAVRKIHPDWGWSGAKGAPMVSRFGTKDVLDYGCGMGLLGKTLGFPIQEYDPGKPGKDIEPVPAEVVYCGDVMEHVEEESVQDVLAHIKSLVKPGGRAIFVISTRLAGKILPDGRNAHVTIKSGTEWQALLAWHFDKVEPSSSPAPDDVAFVCQ